MPRKIGLVLALAVAMSLTACAPTKPSFAEATTKILDLESSGYNIEICVNAELKKLTQSGSITSKTSKAEQQKAYESVVVDCVYVATQDGGKGKEALNKSWQAILDAK